MLINLVFEVHQPFRVKRDLSGEFDNALNKSIFRKVAEKCYYPATRMFLDLADEFPEFRISFSITGTWIEQADMWEPELIEMFRSFPRRSVEFLAETYYHSLASLWEDHSEFVEQVKMHKKETRKRFGRTPKVFRNTELIYNNRIAKTVKDMGFAGMFAEGVPWVLGNRKPTHLYESLEGLPLLLRHRTLTDDIGYRFSAKWWSEWPLTAEKYASWLSGETGEVINIYMDYETIGEHHWRDTGIFEFFAALPEKVLESGLKFSTPSAAIRKLKPAGKIDVFEFSTTSWADMEMDVSAWLYNEMQFMIFNELKKMKGKIRKRMLDEWRKLQTSDHLHNISTKNWSDGDVHRYFSYFDNPVQGFANLSAALLRVWKTGCARRSNP